MFEPDPMEVNEDVYTQAIGTPISSSELVLHRRVDLCLKCRFLVSLDYKKCKSGGLATGENASSTASDSGRQVSLVHESASDGSTSEDEEKKTPVSSDLPSASVDPFEDLPDYSESSPESD